MLQYLMLGWGFGFAASVQPGPLQAFLLSRAASQGWVRTLPASLAPLLTDGPIALLVLLVVGRLSPEAQLYLRAAGGCLLLYLAWGALREWRRSAPTSQLTPGSGARTLMQAAAVNLLNPNPYLGWALVLGPAVTSAWRQSPVHAVALIAAFYGTMVLALAGSILFAGTDRFLGPRGRRILVLLSAVVLAALGVYQLFVSILPGREA
jgi:threonine/homoserine/homoserine lactone efflux protein